MAHCNLCNKNTRCSCKWGGCPSCNSTNRQISFLNDLLKFWVSKETIKKDLTGIRAYADKIDAYTMYERLNGTISEEEFNEAVEHFKVKPWRSTQPQKKVSEIVDTTGRVNPERSCVFSGRSPWDRCIYCNSIRKYMEGKECPKYNEKPVSTVPGNE